MPTTNNPLPWLTREAVFYKGFVIARMTTRPLATERVSWVVYRLRAISAQDYEAKAKSKREAMGAIDEIMKRERPTVLVRLRAHVAFAKEHVFEAQSELHHMADRDLAKSLERSRWWLEATDRRVTSLSMRQGGTR